MWSSSSNGGSSSSSSHRPTSSISNGSASIKRPAASIQLATHFAVPASFATTTTNASGSSSSSILRPTPLVNGRPAVERKVGRVPASVFARIVGHCALSDVSHVARASRASASVCMSDDRAWEWRCQLAGVVVEKRARRRVSQGARSPPPSQPTPRFGAGDTDDNEDFGGFAEIAIEAPPRAAGSLDLLGSSSPLPSHQPSSDRRSSRGFFPLSPTLPSSTSHRSPPLCDSYLAYRSHCQKLAPYIAILRSSSSISPSQLLSSLFPPSTSPTLDSQSATLQALLRHLSDGIEPTRDWGWLRQVLQGVCDRFESTCLAAFEKAEGRANKVDGGDVKQMKMAAEASWAIWRTLRVTATSSGGGRQQEQRRRRERDDAADWELGRVWVEKREVFYEAGRWDPGQNILKRSDSSGTIHQLDFSPMSEFIAALTRRVLVDGQEAVTVFPGGAGEAVIKAYTERLAVDVLAEYINPLLGQCRLLSQSLFLTACAASFVQAWPIVDVVLSVAGSDDGESSSALRADVESSFYRMFESNMDEYLEEEVDWTQQTLAQSSKAWEAQLGGPSLSAAPPSSTAATFLSSSNPDQVKRNVLAGFRDVLLLPVTIVPATVSYGASAIASGGQRAVSGLSMLNPQKWMHNSTVAATTTTSVTAATSTAPPMVSAETPSSLEVPPGDVAAPTPADPAPAPLSAFDHFQLMLSLDTVLELIQADRESLKRVETFAGYPGRYGRKVRETIEELFVLLLRDVGQRHVAPGFRKAIDQMANYRPGDDDDKATTTEEARSVAPLLQFFELVHIGDTIQSMLQVYFDKELAAYIDKTDFLNAAMQEKKRFESTLDESVAAGLNAGIEVLMNQVEHIIQTHTKPGEYCPPPDNPPLDLGPTQGCLDAIACLSMHCNLLRGSTSKEVLEVFFQEVGLRLHAIVQKHIKRQIISLDGGFQMIADINAYYAFVAGQLKQPRITDEFERLKMVGHVYIVEDAKDLAAIVRDASRYGGDFRPEDLYEFIQRRADWKKIERTVDKAMYAISVKEDCVVM